MSNTRTAEELLNRIFDITQSLYDEMGVHKTERSNSHARLYHLLADLGRTLVNADRASFWRWDKRRHKLITTVALGEDRIEIDEGAGLVGKALSEGMAIVTNDPYHNPYFNADVDKETGYVTKSILVMPIVDCRGETIGCYQVINKLDGEGFHLEEDCKRLSLAAFICGLALESDLFLDDSQRDKLTDIKNRVGFYNDVANRYLPALEESRDLLPVALVMCDIDFFKKVNDTYGHNAGDAVLAFVAKTLRASVRSGDGAYRWGGEEFVLVLRGANLQMAGQTAERIRDRLENGVIFLDDMEIRITMSFGCSVMDRSKSVEEN
ncbi:MAG: sensor domain-containing diguanylate cyclase, partial [Lachnospiraceae bacterium]|nr:sensor domain-containing diguanylate cyclase [Lachnospiraceae bacterium]